MSTLELALKLVLCHWSHTSTHREKDNIGSLFGIELDDGQAFGTAAELSSLMLLCALCHMYFYVFYVHCPSRKGRKAGREAFPAAPASTELKMNATTYVLTTLHLR